MIRRPLVTAACDKETFGHIAACDNETSGGGGGGGGSIGCIVHSTQCNL